MPGRGCLHLYKAIAAMEGVGMDAFGMATNVGWDIYPIGSSASQSEIYHGKKGEFTKLG